MNSNPIKWMTDEELALALASLVLSEKDLDEIRRLGEMAKEELERMPRMPEVRFDDLEPTP